MAREEACNVAVVSSELLVFGRGLTQNSKLTIKNSAKRSMAHLGSQRIRSNGDEFETSRAPTVGALGSNGFIVEHLVLIRFQPHELRTLWTGSDLR